MTPGPRLVAAVILAVATVGGMVSLDRILGSRRPAAGGPPGPVSGGWFCPHGGGKGRRAWVVVANPSGEDATLRVTTLGAKTAPTESPAEVFAGTTRYLEVPATDGAASSEVEFFGAPVAAAMVASGPEGKGVAAEPCAPVAGRRWFLPEGTTVRGERTLLVAMNPFSTEAALQVSIIAPERVLRPGPLDGVVVPPRRSLAIDLGQYALGEEALAAAVRVSLGRVVVAGLGRSSSGLRATVASPVRSTVWVLPGAGGEGGTDLQVAALGRRDAPFRVRIERTTGQEPALEEASVDGESVAVYEVAAEEAALVVEAAGREPFVTARRSYSGEESAATAGTSARASRWVALPASGPEGGGAKLILVNPGEASALARVTLLSELGPVDAPDLATVAVGPGRILVLDLSAAAERPVAAVVEVENGTLVPAQASITEDGYALAVGVPMERVSS